ncbi:RNA polymerase I-specific transcription initiation factor RRN3-like isoform X1 [Macrobrachium nipponense]|uniref:RNA polymerase I-specific transcription initiation factor RRN3-like isoform X1 n=1 Tax=Macrobrachium nipponense TaxID=159736 RepID=UPI0030C7DCE0
MTHITILREEADPKESFTLNLCGNCGYGCHPSSRNYHCPLCHPSKFKAKPSEDLVKKHLNDHFTIEKKVVHIKGYKITICSLPCSGKSSLEGQNHLHCPFCPELTKGRRAFISHIQRHSSSPSSSCKKEKLPSRQRTSRNFNAYDEICRLNKSLNDSKVNIVEDPSSQNVTLDDISSTEDVHQVISEYKKTGISKGFERIFGLLSKEGDFTAKMTWIIGMTECVKLLDRKADKIVITFMKMSLFSCQELANATYNFIGTLLAQHNYYAHHVLKILFQHLVPQIEEEHQDDMLVTGGCISKEEAAVYNRVISAIIMINSDIPMTQENLLILARKSVPYFQVHVHKHAVYTRNLLLLASYLPKLRLSVLEVIIANMITIDVHAPRSELAEEDGDEDILDSSDDEDVFDMEVEDSEGKQRGAANKSIDGNCPLDSCQVPRPMTHKAGNTLDVLMSIMLQYVHDVSHGVHKPKTPEHLREIEMEAHEREELDCCRPGILGSPDFDPKRMGRCECDGHRQDVDSVKKLYNDLKDVFSNLILRTHASSHVQFLLFYIISLRPGLLPFFADFLINNKFKDINTSVCIRKNAMAYVGSLLARGKHITLLDVHACLESIRDWCNEYLDAQERLPERNYEDLMLHGGFYSACQTMFYVFTFRYKQYTESKKALSLARSLNFDRIIHSKLNPLNVCTPAVVNNFAAVAHHFQVVYCYAVIENNKRLQIPVARIEDYLQPVTVLESFFPFDPYLLNRLVMPREVFLEF